MAVRADERFSGYPEALKMHLVADAVAGAGKAYAVLFCDRADKAVVVGVFKARLKRVVVYVSHALFCLYPRYAHGLVFDIRHGAGGVLGESLVNADCNLVSFFEFSCDKMFF